MSSRLRSSTRASTVASESLAETMAETKTRGDTRKSTAPRPIKGSELARIIRIAFYVFVLATGLIGGLIYYISQDKIQLHPKNLTAEQLKSFGARVEYALRYQTLLFAWLTFNIFAVIYGRLTKKALNPLETTEKHVQSLKNILTNSFEQVVLSAFLQLIFVSFAPHNLVLKFIPAVNIVMFVGRVAFFLGYPLYRTFGFTLSLHTNTILAGYNLYQLGAYAGLY